jgi:hypothetical protein
MPLGDACKRVLRKRDKWECRGRERNKRQTGEEQETKWRVMARGEKKKKETRNYKVNI